MGQSSSVPLGGRRKSIRSSWRSPFHHRSQTHKGNLSATFNVLDTNTKMDQLNVNSASEEELMTLPGISRADAHNIVEYRQRLGRFKKVEDLALVSGIGADKLALIRPEICVGHRRSPSCASSCTQSVDSLLSADVKPSPRNRHLPLINVNTATVFELQALPGFNQELAANIVDYRDTHGLFSTLDQVTKVKGMNHMLLGAVRCRLTLQSDPFNTPTRNGVAQSASISHSTPKFTSKFPSQNLHVVVNGKVSGHCKDVLLPVKSPLPNGIGVQEILDVLSACSPRPAIEDHFDGKRNCRSVIRLASWNLSGLSTDKAANPGVKEVVCRTILENRFSIIAVQDVDAAGLKLICKELNCPSVRRIKEWKENSSLWQHKTVKGVGFLWDSHKAISPVKFQDDVLLNTEPNTIEALFAEFMIGDYPVCLINVQPSRTEQCVEENDIIKQVEGRLIGEQIRSIVICNFLQFKAICKGDSYFCAYEAVLPLNAITRFIFHSLQDPNNNDSDNIFISKDACKIYADKSGVVHQGLTHLAIPRNWAWGGPASDHCPVWCELFTSQLTS